MFILRQIAENGTETNSPIGDEYTLIQEITSPEEFEEIFNRVLGRPTNMEKSDDPRGADKIYGFLEIGYSENTIPLYYTDVNYIMTEEGKTFANVSRR